MMFKETLHRINLTILDAPLRNCRQFQEKIVDSYDDGRLKFAWDIIKENFFSNKDNYLVEICRDCMLNIYFIEFGCRGELYNLEYFINFLSVYFPHLTILKYNFINDKIDFASTQKISEELKNFLPESQDILWPVAKVILNDKPVLRTLHDGTQGELFYPWTGKEEKEYTFGNEGYQIGLSKEGIFVQRNYIQELPQNFKLLWREGSKVLGKSDNDDIISFEPQGGLLPGWNLSETENQTELIFSNMPAGVVFKDAADTLNVFFERAKNYNIGVEINKIR